jgi:exosortase
MGALLLPELVNQAHPDWYVPVYKVMLFGAPFLLAWQVWAVRSQLGALRDQPTVAGIGLVSVAMAIYYAGMKAAQAHTVIISFVVLLYGLVLALAGRKLFQVLFFPITFLFLMVPLNFLDEFVGFPLRMLVAKGATGTLNWLGITAFRYGTGIYSSVFRFDVADPCSGIRSLMALTTVTAAYAYVTQRAQWKRWVLFLSAMPLAVLGNMARVISIAQVAQVYGQQLATKTYHDYSGYIVFGVALSSMVIIGLLLNVDYRRVWQNLMKPVETKEFHE